MRTSKTYDRHQRLLETATRKLSDDKILSSHSYTYNRANQRTAATNETSSVWEYSYDSLGQVIFGERKDNAGNQIQKHTYDFDTIGNRKQATNQGVVEDYNKNTQNQYESRKTTKNGRQTSSAFHYDEDGNLIRDDKWTYEWNAENRLIAMERRDGERLQRFDFHYDRQGRQV